MAGKYPVFSNSFAYPSMAIVNWLGDKLSQVKCAVNKQKSLIAGSWPVWDCVMCKYFHLAHPLLLFK